MHPNNKFSRRKFIINNSLAAGAALSGFSPLLAQVHRTNSGITVGNIMDAFISEVPGGVLQSTVDTLKSGDRNTEVTGVITTMFATVDIIKKTIAAKANFIIAHEPTFYNHPDETEWLENDEVFNFKKSLLTKNSIAVWRNHDYVHRHVPDGVINGVVNKLAWQPYFNASNRIANIPITTLQQLIEHAKTKLNITSTRYIGKLDQPCNKVLLMPGAAGGKRQIEAIIATKPDVIMCGEVQEWETAEYVRDANAAGYPLALIVMGHIDSEEPGSAFMADWLKKKFKNLPVTHIPTQNALHFL